MATLFAVTTSLIAMGQRGDIQDAQRAWLNKRESCGDSISCLTEAYDAREAFITSSTQTVMPVVRIDGRAVGAGKPGPIAQRLRLKFHQFAAISSG